MNNRGSFTTAVPRLVQYFQGFWGVANELALTGPYTLFYLWTQKIGLPESGVAHERSWHFIARLNLFNL